MTNEDLTQLRGMIREEQRQSIKGWMVLGKALELGPSHMPDLTPDPAFEVVATDFIDLAQQLGMV